MQIVVDPKSVTLVECPPGLFMFNNNLGVKTEYRCINNGVEAYCADSGEYFWGGAKSREERLNLLVNPATFQ